MAVTTGAISMAEGELQETPVSIMARLRQETRPEHDAIEGSMDLLGDGLARSNYRDQLVKFLGFLGPVEARLESLGGWERYGIDLGARGKTSLLRDDLRALGGDDLESLPVCQELPELSDMAEGFGCLYVLEGSTLGGQFISRHVGNVLGVTPEPGGGGRYFHAYGERTGSMWREFGTGLTAFAAECGGEDRIVASAIATFRALRTWFMECPVGR